MRLPMVFAAFANELEAAGYLRQLPEEARQIQAVLRDAPCEVVLRYNITLENLVDVLQDQAYRSRIAVFHYGGHAGGDLLSLEHPSGNNRPTYAQGLAGLLGQLPSLGLVFLNGCATQAQVEHLHNAGIPAVLATSEKIADQTARNFAVRFYKGLAEGQSIGAAFEVAQAEQQAALGTAREAYRDVMVERRASGEWPWRLHLLKAEVANWNLSEASQDPLFGLPPIPKDPPYLPKKPFRHLSHFSEADAEVFFGRSARIRELYDSVSTGGKPLLLLYGQSGVGKSSLLDAGLTPRLKAAGYEVRYARRDASLGLAGTLKGMLGNGAGPTVLILDQLEEAYTRTPNPKAAQDEMTALALLLAQYIENPSAGRILLSFRKEWLSEIETALQDLPFIKLAPLEALGLQGIKEAITGPTSTERLRREYHLEIEPGLPEEMAADLLDRNSPIGPTLQLTLTKMWDKASDWDNQKNAARNLPPYRFDHTLYEDFQHKGLGEILEQQLQQLEQAHPQESASGLSLDLLAFHTTALGTSAQRIEAELIEQYGVGRMPQIQALLQHCKDLYLLSDPPGVVKATRLSHDTLAPYIREHFDKSELPGQRACRILESREPDWQDGNTGSPLDETDLALVEKGLAGTRMLNSDQQRLYRASLDARDAARQLENSRRRRERRTTGIVVAMAVIVGLLGLFWFFSVSRARVERAQLYTFGASLLSSEAYDQVALLYLQADRNLNSADSREQLQQFLDQGVGEPGKKRKILQVAKSFVTRDHVQENGLSSDGLSFSPDGRYLASANRKGQVMVWNVETGKPTLLGQDKILGNEADRVAFSPDGSVLAAGGWRGNLNLWLKHGASFSSKCVLPEDIARPENDFSHFVTALAFASSGNALVAGHADGRLTVGDAECIRRSPLSLSGGSQKRVLAVAFSPDQSQVISMDQTGLLRCTGINEWKPMTAVKEGGKLPFAATDQVLSAAFSPGGDRLWVGVEGSDGSKVRILTKQPDKPCTWKSSDEPLAASVIFGLSRNTWAAAQTGFVYPTIDGKTYIGKISSNIRSLAYQPGTSGLLAVGDQKGHITLWVFEPGQGLGLRQRICRITNEGTFQIASDALGPAVGLNLYDENCKK